MFTNKIRMDGQLKKLFFYCFSLFLKDFKIAYKTAIECLHNVMVNRRRGWDGWHIRGGSIGFISIKFILEK